MHIWPISFFVRFGLQELIAWHRFCNSFMEQALCRIWCAWDSYLLYLHTLTGVIFLKRILYKNYWDSVIFYNFLLKKTFVYFILFLSFSPLCVCMHSTFLADILLRRKKFVLETTEERSTGAAEIFLVIYISWFMMCHVTLPNNL